MLTDIPLSALIADLETAGIAVALGPVRRPGGQSPLWSIYFRDPDGNLIEVANPVLLEAPLLETGCAPF